MHFFDFTPRSAPARLVRLAVCTLLPAFIQEAAAVGMQRPSTFGSANSVNTPPQSRPSPAPRSSPYLLVCLPPPLRFAEPVKPADPVSELPTVLGPPHPGGLLEEIATVNQQAAITPASPVNAATPPAAAAPAPVAIPAAQPQTGISILPDDTPRAIRAEDVLLYFQLPSASPSNGQPPRSSATYKQQ